MTLECISVYNELMRIEGVIIEHNEKEKINIGNLQTKRHAVCDRS